MLRQIQRVAPNSTSIEAWKETLELAKQFNLSVHLSYDDFYELAYEPKTDEVASHWTEAIE